MAPEIYQKEKYTTKCDVFSLGLTFYSLITGGKKPVVDGIESYMQDITLQNWLQKNPFNPYPINFNILGE